MTGGKGCNCSVCESTLYNLWLWKAGHAQSHQESASKPCFSSSSPSLTPLLTEDNWILLVPRFLELSTPGCLHHGVTVGQSGMFTPFVDVLLGTARTTCSALASVSSRLTYKWCCSPVSSLSRRFYSRNLRGNHHFHRFKFASCLQPVSILLGLKMLHQFKLYL